MAGFISNTLYLRKQIVELKSKKVANDNNSASHIKLDYLRDLNHKIEIALHERTN